jgi:hypothetical protein
MVALTDQPTTRRDDRSRITVQTISPQATSALGTNGFTLIFFSVFRIRAMSQLFCMRISVSMETPKAYSMRSAISGDKSTCSFNSAESAGRVTPSAFAASVTDRGMAPTSHGG